MRLHIMFWPVVLLLVAAPPLSRAETNEEMLSACRPIAEAHMSQGKVALPETFEAGVCWGAFAIIQNLTVWVDTKTSKRHFGVCTPANSTRTQLIAIFVEYAKRNPRRYSENFSDVAFDALRESFPCET
jgi:hypothetical protein